MVDVEDLRHLERAIRVSARTRPELPGSPTGKATPCETRPPAASPPRPRSALTEASRARPGPLPPRADNPAIGVGVVRRRHKRLAEVAARKDGHVLVERVGEVIETALADQC